METNKIVLGKQIVVLSADTITKSIRAKYVGVVVGIQNNCIMFDCIENMDNKALVFGALTAYDNNKFGYCKTKPNRFRSDFVLPIDYPFNDCPQFETFTIDTEQVNQMVEKFLVTSFKLTDTNN